MYVPNKSHLASLKDVLSSNQEATDLILLCVFTFDCVPIPTELVLCFCKLYSCMHECLYVLFAQEKSEDWGGLLLLLIKVSSKQVLK